MVNEIIISWLIEALTQLGGKGSIIQICKVVWKNHEDELRANGDIFYTWQYDIRWAAKVLRDRGKLQSVDVSPKGIWELS